MFFEEGEPGPQENLYDDTDIVELEGDNWNSIINNRDEPWLVQFYKPNNDDCVALQEDYKQIGNTFKDFLKMGAVNCRKQRDLCRQASVNEFPGLRWFPEDNKKEPLVFEGEANAKLLGKWISSNMEDFSTILVDKRQMREWVDSQKIPVVVLFSDKREVAPMWKALSREFKDRVALGTVLRCDKNGVFKTELQQAHDVRIPGVIHVDPLGELGSIAEKFSSQLKKDVLTLWLQKIIAISRRAGPTASFKEWSKQRFEAGDCGVQDGQFCFLWLKAGADKKVEEAMRSLAVKYRTDPIKMMWVNVELNPSVLETFGLDGSEGQDGSDIFIAYRSKRGRFKRHEGELTLKELDTFVDGVLNGGPLLGKAKAEKLEL